MTDRFRRLDAMMAHEADEGVRGLLLELRRKWVAENQEVEADFCHWAAMQTKIEALESALAASQAEVAMLRLCVQTRDIHFCNECGKSLNGCTDPEGLWCPVNTHPEVLR